MFAAAFIGDELSLSGSNDHVASGANVDRSNLVTRVGPSLRVVLVLTFHPGFHVTVLATRPKQVLGGAVVEAGNETLMGVPAVLYLTSLESVDFSVGTTCVPHASLSMVGADRSERGSGVVTEKTLLH